MDKPRQKDPCSCGSGKQYRYCCALKGQKRKKLLKRFKNILMMIVPAAVLAFLVYGASQMRPTVPYTDVDITEVDFSGLTEDQKDQALLAANRAPCTCGCGMNLAQCVVTDSTCPYRPSNIRKIEAMVREARE